MSRLSAWKKASTVILLCAATAIAAPAQTYTKLMSFNGNTAAGPMTPLTQGIDGALYGTTYYGGTGKCSDGQGIGCGIVFRLTRNGQFQVLYNFLESGSSYPANSLVLGGDGNLYGTAIAGNGTIFEITAAGKFTTIYQFTGGPGGSQLSGGLTLGIDGNFYGTTYDGGTPSNSCPGGCGTIYKMTPSGVLTTLYSFCPQNYCPDGENPNGPLVQGVDGNFYGTARNGGLYKAGTAFEISPSGNFRLLYTFSNAQPIPGGLILASDGNFYGAVQYHLYRLSPQGVITFLPQFFPTGWSDPSLPIQGTDGNLYGTLQIGPAGDNLGGIFQEPLAGQDTILYSFAGYPNDGSNPQSALVQRTDGTFYGVTFAGGSSPCNYSLPGCGTVFSLDMGLSPFVAFVHAAGKVGQTGGILGQGFTGTSSVSLNGTPATFTVISDTFIKATVPAGATTGYVTVTTPAGTLTSNVPFHILK